MSRMRSDDVRYRRGAARAPGDLVTVLVGRYVALR